MTTDGHNRKAQLVEFVGVTGSGKSTHVQALHDALIEQGRTAYDAREIVLKRFKLHFLKSRLLRSLALDLITLVPFIRYSLTRDGRALLCLAQQVFWRNVTQPHIAINLCRNYIKTIGLYILLQRILYDHRYDEFVIWDQGTLHMVHSLFVHLDWAPDGRDIELFAELAPKPDMVVWIKSTTERSVRCIAMRGHSRVKDPLEHAWSFVEHGQITFRTLCAHKAIRERVFEVDNTPDETADSAVVKENAAEIARHLIQDAEA